MKNLDANRALVAAFATIAALAPFLNKAFHIDDPLFLWMAQQISAHPDDPYGFAVNWYGMNQPMFSIMQNPPVSSYYMALMASFLGWSELAMHCAFLIPAVAAVLGTFFLARRFCDSPLLAALLLLFMPVFLVSATGVMCDVWLLALWVWSIECWLHGLERNIFWLFLLSALLAAAAALTKYFGVALVPLLAAYTLAKEWRSTSRLLYLLLPVLVTLSYEVISRTRYGQGLFSSAMFYSWKQTSNRNLFQHLLIGLSFTGGCLFSVIFYAPLLKSRRALIIGTAIFVVIASALYLVPGRAALSKSLLNPGAIEGALFLTTGIGILLLTLADLFQRKSADSVLLGLWVLGTFVFAAILNWTITSRTFLPMAPAVIILLIRQWQSPACGKVASDRGKSLPILPLRTAAIISWPIVPAALVSLVITIGDYKLANTARVAASQFQQRFQDEPGNIWFEGHWGFQYYMQKWRAKPLDLEQRDLVSGDLLIVPIDNTNVSRKPAVATIASFEQLNYVQFFTTTMNRELGAGFYSSKWGPVPWLVSSVPSQHYFIFRIK